MQYKRSIIIQLLRVFACLSVFFVHFGQRVNLNGTARLFTNFGMYGVQLFFLISGYLAGKTFFENPGLVIKDYYKKRMISILPLYYVVIIYYFITENILNQFVTVIPHDKLGVGWFRYLFLLNGFLNSDTYFWSNLGITWTIPIFAFFYLIAPWILKKVNTIRLAIGVWILVFAITKILSKVYSCVIFENLHFLFWGVTIYWCVKTKNNQKAQIVYAVLALIATIIQNIMYSYVSIFSIILLLADSMESVNLSHGVQKIIDIIDKYSYTLYLMHGVVFCSILDRLNRLGVSKIIIAIIAIVGTIFTTWFVGKYIEKPIQNYWIKKDNRTKIQKT